MKYQECALIMGNGNAAFGREIIEKIALAVDRSRKLHPVFAEGPYQALGVIGEGFWEFEQTVTKESPQRQKEKAMDVAVTALRYLMGEYTAKEAMHG